MAKRDQDVHFLASKEEVERIHEKMDELGIRSMGAYLRKMALDGYCIRLDLQDVKARIPILKLQFLKQIMPRLVLLVSNLGSFLIPEAFHGIPPPSPPFLFHFFIVSITTAL